MTEPPVLRVDVSRVEPGVRDRALVALDFLGTSIGVRIDLVRPDLADLRYGGTRDDGPNAWLPCWPETYEAATAHRQLAIEGLPCWMPETRLDDWPPDLIGSTWRLLALVDETQVAESSRGPGGIFLSDALPVGRRRCLDEPLVEWHAAMLVRHLERRGIRLDDRVERWPGGRSYAAVVTHDVDGPRLQQPTELAKALGKAILRRSGGEARAFAAGVGSKLLRRPDPYFAFEGWARAERELGVRSAFYLYVRTGTPRHPRDPVYDLDGHPRWAVLRRLADDGWEFGLHAGIHAADTASGLQQERERLVELLDRPVVGLRHHYWRLDWRSPATTFEQQLNAGFAYDASIAWRDRPGFRAGTSLPYFPAAVDGERPLRLVEIPTSLMDGHLFEYLRLDPAMASAAADELRARIARAGGVINIDWHERTLCDRFSYRGWATVGLDLMHKVAGDAWVTTPAELASWWRARAETVGLPEIRSLRPWLAGHG